MDLMNRVYRNHLDSFITVFINDILIYSKNEGDHIEHLRVVLQTLKEHQLFAKYSNFEFLFRLVAFLGHIIFSNRVEVDPKKTEAVKNWPRPLTPTDIGSFLGLEGYNGRFVDEFASIASPLTTLTQ